MNNTIITHKIGCSPNLTENFAIILLFSALPFHLFVGKILAFNLRFDNPRHYILLCLSASDSLQVAVTAIASVASKIGDFELGTQGCDGLRYTITFNATLTFIVSSLSLVVLSIERYIACYHSFRVPELLSNTKIIRTLVGFWICGLIGGGIACIPGSRGNRGPVLTSSEYIYGIFLFFTLPASFILIVIQLLLLRLSMKKLNIVQDIALASNETEEPELRRRQIKVAFVAGAVVFSYLVCMLPTACLVIADHFVRVPFNYITLAVSLGMANTLLNPFIYGLGMLDTREAITKELKTMKNFALVKLGLKDEFDT